MTNSETALGTPTCDYRQMAIEVRREVAQIYKGLLFALHASCDRGEDNADPYDHYPFLFKEYFPRLSQTQLKAIAISGVLYCDHLCLLDNAADHDVPPDCLHLLLSSLLHEEAILTLTPLFWQESVFWTHLSSCHRAFASAVHLEKIGHRGRIVPYGVEEFLEIAQGKAALSKATTAAMASLDGSLGKLTGLWRSQDFFNAAAQMYDDVQDWKEDFARGDFSYVVTCGLVELQSSKQQNEETLPDLDQLGHCLYYSQHIEKALALASGWCEEAQEGLDRCILAEWIGVIKALHLRILKLRDDLCAIRMQTVQRSRGLLTPGLKAIAQHARDFLLREQAAGYPEAQHRMGFHTFVKDGAQDLLHTGCVFQRAILAEVLLDLRDRELLAGEDMLNEEIARLMQARLTNVRGGWSYFPTLRNLPPDADDLGQMLQVLARSHCPLAHDLVRDDLYLLFKDNRHTDGSFETWIVDRDAKDEDSLGMVKGIEESWGDGADVEVVANLAYGLSLFDADNFAEKIARAAAFVEAQQVGVGNWHPTWYGTTFYGTYTATRLLAHLRLGSTAIAKAADYLLQEQRTDGGFGDKCSTPLETALALLTLCGPLRACSAFPIQKRRALRYLGLSALDDGTWPLSDFISMDTNRANRSNPGYAPRFVTYRSRTVTTAYVLKAILVARDVL